MKTMSKHFTVEEIADGVWATICTPGGSHICNSGIVDLGNQTLVFDTGLCNESAKDLKEAAFHLTGRSPDIIANSHFHNDHFWGNQVFQGARLVASEKNAEIAEPKWAQEAQGYYKLAVATIEATKMKLNSESEYEREQAKIWTGFLSGIISAVPSLQYISPSETFNERTTLGGDKRSVEIIEHRNGHSESDYVLYLPQERIVFTGDLCCIDYHPYFALGDPMNFPSILESLKSLDAEIVIPGHGPIGHSSAFDGMKEYLQTMVALVKDAVSNGASREEVLSLPVPEKYLGLQGRDIFYRGNLNKLYTAIN